MRSIIPTVVNPKDIKHSVQMPRLIPVKTEEQQIQEDFKAVAVHLKKYKKMRENIKEEWLKLKRK